MRLSGVIPANILPMDRDLRIDEPGYGTHLETLVSSPGVGGVTCNGHAAEVASLEPSERLRALAIAVETVAGRVPVICGLYANDERDAVDAAQAAEREGADALLMFPPNSLLYDEDPSAAYRYFANVASATSLPLIAFMYPQFTAVQYGPELLTRLCTIDSVVALKEWSLDIAVYERNLEIVRSAPHHIAMLSSFSTHLLPSLSVGADGILSGHGSVIAGLQAQLLQAVDVQELGTARSIYRRIQILTRVVYRDPMPNMYARMKEQLGMLGHPIGPGVRPPLRPVAPAERAELRSALVRAGMLEDGAR